MNAFRDPSEFSRWMKLIMIGWIVATGLMLVFEFGFTNTVDPVSFPAWLAVLLLQVFPMIKLLLLLIFVLFLMLWLGRSYSNIWSMGLSGLKYDNTMAVLWFFIPIANLAMPYLVLQELFKASDPETDMPGSRFTWKMGSVPGMLFGWWVGVVLAFGIGNFYVWSLLVGDLPFIGYHMAGIMFYVFEAFLMFVIWNMANFNDERQRKKWERIFPEEAEAAPVAK